jgi:hypothetical protein
MIAANALWSELQQPAAGLDVVVCGPVEAQRVSPLVPRDANQCSLMTGLIESDVLLVSCVN